MQKKYIVRLTEVERSELRHVIQKLKGSSQKVRRAQILLKADSNGANWTDERIGAHLMVGGVEFEGQWVVSEQGIEALIHPS